MKFLRRTHLSEIMIMQFRMTRQKRPQHGLARNSTASNGKSHKKIRTVKTNGIFAAALACHLHVRLLGGPENAHPKRESGGIPELPPQLSSHRRLPAVFSGNPPPPPLFRKGGRTTSQNTCPTSLYTTPALLSKEKNMKSVCPLCLLPRCCGGTACSFCRTKNSKTSHRKTPESISEIPSGGNIRYAQGVRVEQQAGCRLPHSKDRQSGNSTEHTFAPHQRGSRPEIPLLRRELTRP